MNDTALTFALPHYLITGLLACALTWRLLRSLRQRNRAALEHFASDTLLPRLLQGYSVPRRRLKTLLLLFAIFLIFTALARPQKGVEWQEVTRRGIDIAIALDTSKSMLAPDVVPNRLQRAKLAIADFIRRLEGDRVALIPFAGTGFTLCPPTLDYDAFLQSLQMLDTDIMPRPGTNIAEAIRTSMEAMARSSNEKILILLSDGEELEGSAVDAAEEAAKQGARIYTVGVGSAAGDLILIPGKGGNSTYLKDVAGNAVKSKLDEQMLTAIAAATGGLYFPLGRKGEALEQIYDQAIKGLEKHDIQQRMKRIPVERFEWFLLGAIILLMLEFGLNEGGAFPETRRAVEQGVKGALLAGFALIAAHAEASPRAATEAYEAGKYGDAIRELEPEARRGSDPVLHFNLGAAYYKNKDYDSAIEQFNKALSGGTHLDVQSKAYFNMGNAHYRRGEGSTSSKEKIASWQQALGEYEHALKLNPEDEHAAHNREYVKKQLEELMQKQQQRESTDDQSGEQDKKKQKQKKQDNPQSEQEQQEQQQEQSPESAQQTDAQNSEEKEGNDKRNAEQAEQSHRPETTPETNEKARENKEKRDENANRQVGRKGRAGNTQMTAEEASQLLDSLRNEEKQVMPLNPKALVDDDEVEKDW